MRKTRVAGFTLLELLVVIAIIGILAGSLFWFSRPYLTKQHVGEAASQLQRDLERLRSVAAKTSRGSKMKFDGNSPNQYTMEFWNGSSNEVKVVNLPYGVNIQFGAGGTGEITYTAPYAEVAAVNRTINLYSKYGEPEDKLSKNIFIVGVTGKVN